MFVGTNELHLNQATMMLALQQWLDRSTVSKPAAHVLGIRENDGTFIVRLDQPAEKK